MRNDVPPFHQVEARARRLAVCGYGQSDEEKPDLASSLGRNRNRWHGGSLFLSSVRLNAKKEGSHFFFFKNRLRSSFCIGRFSPGPGCTIESSNRLACAMQICVSSGR